MILGRTSHLRAVPLVTAAAALLAGACQSGSTQPTGSSAQSIRSGTQDAAANDKKIFLTIGPKPGTGFNVEGTAFDVLYPRCLLTAAHDLQERIYAGVDLTGNVDNKPQQDVQTRVPHPDAQMSPRDIALLWMKALKSTQTVPRLQEADYAKMELKDGVGLASANLKQDGKLDQESAGAPVDVRLFGYGDSTTTMGVDGDNGTRRYGDVEARYFIQGSAQGVFPKFQGGFYQLVAKAGAAARGACSGDSGGPVVHDGKAFAVISNSEDVACNQVSWTRATSIDKGAIEGKKSNWDWVHETAEKTCGKKMEAGKGCDGSVTGSISPAQQLPLDLTLNGEIRIGEDSCFGEEDPSEIVHYGQTITLTATPHPGYQFDRWTGTYCPCDGSTSPTCAASYDDIGFYSETVSIDQSLCVALFDPIDPLAPPPARCCEATGLCMVCIEAEDPPDPGGTGTSGGSSGGSSTSGGTGGAGGSSSAGGAPGAGAGGGVSGGGGVSDGGGGVSDGGGGVSDGGGGGVSSGGGGAPGGGGGVAGSGGETEGTTESGETELPGPGVGAL